MRLLYSKTLHGNLLSWYIESNVQLDPFSPLHSDFPLIALATDDLHTGKSIAPF
jgi:hypothetical protein